MPRLVEDISKQEIQDKIIDCLRGKYSREKTSREIMEGVIGLFGDVDDEHKLRERISGSISGCCRSNEPTIEKINDVRYKLL